MHAILKQAYMHASKYEMTEGRGWACAQAGPIVMERGGVGSVRIRLQEARPPNVLRAFVGTAL
jgi:hypothetical protein